MARRSLSVQVIEEVDRARGLLKPIQDMVDPMTSHMVGAVLESLHRVETMCLNAQQRDVNNIIRDNVINLPSAGEPAAVKPAATHRKTTRQSPAKVRGERR